jgi:hypothetical protein
MMAIGAGWLAFKHASISMFIAGLITGIPTGWWRYRRATPSTAGVPDLSEQSKTDH